MFLSRISRLLAKLPTYGSIDVGDHYLLGQARVLGEQGRTLRRPLVVGDPT